MRGKKIEKSILRSPTGACKGSTTRFSVEPMLHFAHNTVHPLAARTAYEFLLSLEKCGCKMQNRGSSPLQVCLGSTSGTSEHKTCHHCSRWKKNNFPIQQLRCAHSVWCLAIPQHHWWVLYAFHLQNIIISRADSEAIHQTINAALLPNESLKSTCFAPYVSWSQGYTELSHC